VPSDCAKGISRAPIIDDERDPSRKRGIRDYRDATRLRCRSRSTATRSDERPSDTGAWIAWNRARVPRRSGDAPRYIARADVNKDLSFVESNMSMYI